MSEIYEGREQSLVKHFILREYLQRFAFKVGSHWDTISYVDCFSGPWQVQSDDFHDASFAIALNVLRKVRDALRERGREVRIRCFFLERDAQAYARLKSFADCEADSTIEIQTRNARLDESVDEILRFVREGGTQSFPFFFIDPTGWAGIEYDVVAPLMRVRPCEVLINLMTSFIRRFIRSGDAATRVSFERTFDRFLPQHASLDSLADEDFDEEIVAGYVRLVRETGRFEHVCKAIVLNPLKDRTHFHLVYGTRNPAGLEVFKEAERKAMSVQEKARAEAQGRLKEQKEGGTLFARDAMYDPTYYESLRTRYLARAHSRVAEQLRTERQVAYDALWLTALDEPLVWEPDLKQWLVDWQRRGVVAFEGLSARASKPQRDSNHRIVLLRQEIQ